MHKASLRPSYNTWRGMKARCDDPRNISFKNYGAKGITYCERWKVFQNFIDDMGLRPEGLTLDRIDPAGNYEPSNCRWLSVTEQIRSRRNSLTYNGKPLIEACKEAGLKYETVHSRITRRGWSIEKALSTPINPRYLRNHAPVKDDANAQ